MFASRTKKAITVQDDDGQDQTVTIKKLSARQLDKAREARQQFSMSNARTLGGDVLKALRDVETPDAVKKLQSVDGHYDQYDQATILDCGLHSWTFKEDINSQKADLDKKNATLLFRAIVDLSDPLPEVKEEQVKND